MDGFSESLMVRWRFGNAAEARGDPVGGSNPNLDPKSGWLPDPVVIPGKPTGSIMPCSRIVASRADCTAPEGTTRGPPNGYSRNNTTTRLPCDVGTITHPAHITLIAADIPPGAGGTILSCNRTEHAMPTLIRGRRCCKEGPMDMLPALGT